MESLKFLVTDRRIILNGFGINPSHVQRDFLKYTAQQIKFDLQQNQPALLEEFKVNVKDRSYQIWEHRPLSVPFWSPHVFQQKLDYIHQNPTQEKWKLSDIPESYHYSDARYYYLNVDDWGFITHYAG